MIGFREARNQPRTVDYPFTLFEMLVIVIQAYIFTLLTAVYIAGAESEHH